VLKETLREHLRQTCSDQELRQWFDPLQVALGDDERILRVIFPHAFFADWFSENVQGKFEEQLSHFLGNGYRIAYRRPHVKGLPAPMPVRAEGTKIDFPFSRQYTFEHFLTNKKNYFPLASAREVAKQNHVQYNPFVICGGNGTGKTHLLKAVANELCKTRDKEDIFVGGVEELHHTYATRHRGDVLAARRSLCERHCLLLDDLQLLRDYPDLQEELVILFNAFYDNKKQMVFCCSDRLAAQQFLQPKLKSRLEWGLIVYLKEPDLDVRVKYIQHTCREKKLPLGKEKMLTLAQSFTDFRNLQGILLKLGAFKDLVQQEIDDKDFERILSHSEDAPHGSVEPERIIAAVADHFGLGREDLVGSKRHQNIVQARQVAMYLCRHLVHCSYPTLGRIFGGKDHSTAMYAVKKVEKMQSDNKETKQLLNELKKQCLSLD
jgi:chromosomal replication initiator protein